MRTYTLIRGQVNYWELTLFEDGEPVGGGVGGEADYYELFEIAIDFCGIGGTV